LCGRGRCDHDHKEEGEEEEEEEEETMGLGDDDAGSLSRPLAVSPPLPGQELFYALHHVFLSANGIFIVVFDLNEAWDCAREDAVSQTSPAAPVCAEEEKEKEEDNDHHHDHDGHDDAADDDDDENDHDYDRGRRLRPCWDHVYASPYVNVIKLIPRFLCSTRSPARSGARPVPS
jgi:hypothetical protein